MGHASLLVSLSRREPEDGRTSGTCILACLPQPPGTGGRENEWDMHPCLSPSAAGNRRTGERVGHASLLVSLSRREPENGRTSGTCILACLPQPPGTGERENEWDMHPCLSPSAAGNRRTGERVGHASLLVSLSRREPENGRTSGICILACLPRLPGTGGRENEWDMHPCLSPSAAGNRRTGGTGHGRHRRDALLPSAFCLLLPIPDSR